VEFFHGGTNLIATVTTPPYSVLWSSVPQAAYTLAAVATDNQLATTTSSPVNVSVGPPVAQMYFIHTDHLNTPRLVANAAGQTVWLWHQAEPFGNNAPDENPGGLGIFEFPLRLPGQYFDKETNLHYNYFRDYDPGVGRYIESDLIGLRGGLNTYSYGKADPVYTTDRFGLAPSRDDFEDILRKAFCRQFDEQCPSYYQRLIKYCQRFGKGFFICKTAADRLYEQCALDQIPVCKPPPNACYPSSSYEGTS
jgi:RHS repeat-associated protein